MTKGVPRCRMRHPDAWRSGLGLCLGGLGLSKQGNGTITRSPRQCNACRETLVRLLFLLLNAARGGISLKMRGVKPLDCIFVRGLNELLIGIHIKSVYVDAAGKARRDLPAQN